MNSVDKEWIFSELRKCTTDLTIENKDDLYRVIGEASLDELALDFDNFLSAATPFLQESDVYGLSLLQDIDKKLSQISGQENMELWTEAAFLSDDRWKVIKEKAQQALKHFSWG